MSKCEVSDVIVNENLDVPNDVLPVFLGLTNEIKEGILVDETINYEDDFYKYFIEGVNLTTKETNFSFDGHQIARLSSVLDRNKNYGKIKLNILGHQISKQFYNFYKTYGELFDKYIQA